MAAFLGGGEGQSRRGSPPGKKGGQHPQNSATSACIINSGVAKPTEISIFNSLKSSKVLKLNELIPPVTFSKTSFKDEHNKSKNYFVDTRMEVLEKSIDKHIERINNNGNTESIEIHHFFSDEA